MTFNITFLRPSWLKWVPDKEQLLPPAQKKHFLAGAKVSVQAIATAPEGTHIKLTLDQQSELKRIGGRNTLYAVFDDISYPGKPDSQGNPSTEAVCSHPASFYRELGPDGQQCIKHYEGCRLSAYLCPKKVWTIGWGSTGSHVYSGLSWTQAQADAQLLKDLERFLECVRTAVTVPITQRQFDALVSFAFNCGPGDKTKGTGFRGSTLLRKLNAKDYSGASKEFGRWTSRGLAGLVARRESERRMFLGQHFQPMN